MSASINKLLRERRKLIEKSKSLDVLRVSGKSKAKIQAHITGELRKIGTELESLGYRI